MESGENTILAVCLCQSNVYSLKGLNEWFQHKVKLFVSLLHGLGLGWGHLNLNQSHFHCTVKLRLLFACCKSLDDTSLHCILLASDEWSNLGVFPKKYCRFALCLSQKAEDGKNRNPIYLSHFLIHGLFLCFNFIFLEAIITYFHWLLQFIPKCTSSVTCMCLFYLNILWHFAGSGQTPKWELCMAHETV